MKNKLTPFSKLVITALIVGSIFGLYKYLESRGFIGNYLKKAESAAPVSLPATNSDGSKSDSNTLLEDMQNADKAAETQKATGEAAAGSDAESLANDLINEKEEKKEEVKTETKDKKEAFDF